MLLKHFGLFSRAVEKQNLCFDVLDKKKCMIVIKK